MRTGRIRCACGSNERVELVVLDNINRYICNDCIQQHLINAQAEAIWNLDNYDEAPDPSDIADGLAFNHRVNRVTGHRPRPVSMPWAIGTLSTAIQETRRYRAWSKMLHIAVLLPETDTYYCTCGHVLYTAQRATHPDRKHISLAIVLDHALHVEEWKRTHV